MTDQEFYETISGKFAAYELLLAHLLRRVTAISSETERASLRDTIVRQTNIYTSDPTIPSPAKTELQRVIHEVLTKAEVERARGL